MLLGHHTAIPEIPEGGSKEYSIKILQTGFDKIYIFQLYFYYLKLNIVLRFY